MGPNSIIEGFLAAVAFLGGQDKECGEPSSLTVGVTPGDILDSRGPRWTLGMWGRITVAPYLVNGWLLCRFLRILLMLEGFFMLYI